MNQIMIAFLCLSMIFSKNRFPLFRIMLMFLWPNRIIEPLFAAIRLTERTGNGRERAMANGVVFRHETKTRASPIFSHRTLRRL
jgi:hypothetical protein